MQTIKMYLINSGIRRLRITQNKCQLIAESLSPNLENESNIIQFFMQNEILGILLKSNSNNKYSANYRYQYIMTIYQSLLHHCY